MQLASDFRYTLKQLKNNAGFTALCVLLISVGIAMSLVLFSLTWNLQSRTLPFADAGRFVELTLTTPGNPAESSGNFSGAWYEFASASVESFEVFGAARPRMSLAINDGEEAVVASAAALSPALLQATGVPPLLGRTLLPEDEGEGAQPVAVLSYSLWRSYYAGRGDIVGQVSRIRGVPHTIVGVMPPDFGFPINSALWLPLRLETGPESNPGLGNLTLLGRLREGVSLAQANEEIQAISVAFNEEMAERSAQPLTAYARPYPHFPGAPAPMFAVLHVLALTILLLVAFNMGNLLLYRANERTHELAIRSALGGSRARVMRALLLESFVICALGCALGLLFSHFALGFINAAMAIAMAGDSLPFWWDFQLNRVFVGFTLLCALAIWLLAGGIPALRLFSRDLNALLGAGSRGLAKRGSLRLTRTFVALEVIVSCFLLIISMAIVTVTSRDVRNEFGVESANRYSGEVRVDFAGPRVELDQYARALRQEQLVTPGFVDATYTSHTPGVGGQPQSYGLEDREVASNGVWPTIAVTAVADNYFELLGVELVAGRAFDGGDEAQSLPVAIVDRRLADRLWPDESAIGKRIRLNPTGEGPLLTIVGVVAPLYQEYQPLEGRPSLATLFRPFAQTSPTSFTSIVVSTLPAAGTLRAMRESAARAGDGMAIHRLYSLRDSMMLTSRPFLLLRDIFLWVTVLVMLLISSVIYGLISRSYLNRAGEIGLRRALGASDRQAMGVFIREGLTTLAIGLSIGGIGGVLVSGALTGMFPNIMRYLPGVALATLCFIALIVLAASYAPAARAVAMEPGEALRHE